MSARWDRRASNEVRNIAVEYGVFEYASGSLLYSCGSTRVLCAVNIQDGVPHFLRGKGEGWLTAEYAMLPAATTSRTPREASTMRKNGRSVEISRLIGRVLRTAIDPQLLGERTITVDCDVLQADGGTRTASITAASLALMQAQKRWMADGWLHRPFMRDELAAVSVGILDDAPVVDPDFKEDRELSADFNVIMTRSGKLIELQGGAERNPVAWDQFELVCSLATVGAAQIFKQLASFELPEQTALEQTGGVTLAQRMSHSQQSA